MLKLDKKTFKDINIYYIGYVTKKVLSGIKRGIEKVNNNKAGEYQKDSMKITCDSDDKLPLDKQLKFLSVTIVIRSVFEDDGKYYPQAFLNDCLYEL